MFFSSDNLLSIATFRISKSVLSVGLVSGVCLLLGGCGLKYPWESNSHKRIWQTAFMDGNRALLENETDISIKQFQIAAKEASKIEDKDFKLAVTCNRLARAYEKKASSKEALASYVRAIEIFNSLLSDVKTVNSKLVKKELIHSLAQAGALYLKDDKIKSARRNFTRVLELLKGKEGEFKSDDKEVTASAILTYYSLGKISERSHNDSDALELYGRALKLAKENAIVSDKVVSSVMQSYQELLKRLNRPDVESLLVFASQPNTNKVKKIGSGEIDPWNFNIEAGKKAYEKNDCDKAFMHFEKAMNDFGRVNVGNKQFLTTQKWLLKTAIKQENFEKAESLINKSMAIVNASPSDDEYDKLLSEIAKVFRMQKKWKKASDYFIRQVNLRKKLYGDTNVSVAESLSNAGLMYKNMKDGRMSKDCFVKALAIYKTVYGTNSNQYKKTQSYLVKASLLD